MNHKELAIKILDREEGFREKPYYCSENYPTYGHGFKIGEKFAPLPDISITREESLKKLKAWVDSIDKSLRENADTKTSYEACNDARRAILISMAYQLGMYGVLKFRKFLAATANSKWGDAANEMLTSLAAKQAPNRFKRQSTVMLNGSADGIY